MSSRAAAGEIGGRLVFLLPGSTAACRLGLEKLILPELPHLIALASPRAVLSDRSAGEGAPGSRFE